MSSLRTPSSMWLYPHYLGDTTTDGLHSLKATVTPEGDTAVFAVELENSQKLTISLPFDKLGHVQNLISQVATTMATRQNLRADKAHETLLMLAQAAQRPVAFDMFKDPFSNDLIFTYHWRSQAPMALRVDAGECLENMAGIYGMIHKVAN